jgi:PAS domain S-box-containing protein
MDNIFNYLEKILVISAAGGVLFGAFKWIFTLNKNVKEILKEVKPNSGTSIKDQVAKIEKQVFNDSNKINTICIRQKWILDNRPEPIFECDTEGKCTWVNEKYCQLLKHDTDYFLGNGWKNGVHCEDLEMVEKEWDRALKDKRSSISTYRMVDREGTVFEVKVTATRNDNYGYIGHIEILDDKKD